MSRELDPASGAFAGADGAAPASARSPSPAPEPAPPRAPLPVLPYVDPVTSRASWHRNPLWSKLALPAALAYAVTLGCVVAHETLSTDRWYRPAEDAVLLALAVTAPLGVLALTVGVLGHFSPGGRRLAGPAVWVVALTPGAAALLFLTITLAVGRARDELVTTCLAVAIVNAGTVLALRNRVLRESPEERAFDTT